MADSEYKGEIMSEVIITNQNFENEVLQSDKPVLIDFWATWCGPCKMLSPIVAELAEENPDIKVCKVNVDEQPELASQFRVASIPMVFMMKGGEVVDVSLGYKPKEEFVKMIKKHK